MGCSESYLHFLVSTQKSSLVPLFLSHRLSSNKFQSQGGNDDCTCLDFTEPEGRFESDEWIRNHLSNKNMVAAAADLDIDVLFIGDGMVERLNGTVNGAPTDDAAMIKRIFAKSFSKDSGGDIDGLAVGIEGDQVRHLRISPVRSERRRLSASPRV